MTAATAHCLHRPRVLRLVRAPGRNPASSRFSRYLVDVDFQTLDGEKSFAVGGGETLREAIASAREAIPVGLEWQVVRWNHVHGD